MIQVGVGARVWGGLGGVAVDQVALERDILGCLGATLSCTSAHTLKHNQPTSIWKKIPSTLPKRLGRLV